MANFWGERLSATNGSANYNTCSLGSSEDSYNYILQLLILFGVLFTIGAMMANRARRFSYQGRFARAAEGAIQLGLHWHTSPTTDIASPGGSISALGPHLFGGVEAATYAAHVAPGKPLHFLGTEEFNKIPGIKAFFDCFEVISVPLPPKRSVAETDQRLLEASNVAAKELIKYHQKKLTGTTDRTEDLDTAVAQANGGLDKLNNMISEIDAKKEAAVVEATVADLRKGGRVVVFPQGNIRKIGQPHHRVYDGTARAAIAAKAPINVVHLSGHWVLNNPFVPLFIRNWTLYRALFSSLHMNNIKPRLCFELDDHLKRTNAHLSDEEKIRILNAKMYAVFRRDTMTDDDLAEVEEEFRTGKYLEIWDQKIAIDMMQRLTATFQKDLNTMQKAKIPNQGEPAAAAEDTKTAQTQGAVPGF